LLATQKKEKREKEKEKLESDLFSQKGVAEKKVSD